MSFLPPEIKDTLNLASTLRAQKYTNSKGIKISGKLMLLGENIVKLVRCHTLIAKNSKAYLSMLFSTTDQQTCLLKGKVKFAPHQEFVFDYEKAMEISNAFGHELKPCPELMDWNEYIYHVGRRLNTFLGTEIKVVIKHTTEPRRDDYGYVIRAIQFDTDSRELINYRTEMYFEKLDWNKIINLVDEN